MGKKVKEYKSGDFIFAKVKGYPAWPARVQNTNGKRYLVYFYGTGETANLPPNMIFDYAENKEKFTKNVKRKVFNDGVKQIEHDFANNVPVEEVIGQGPIPIEGDMSANDSANDTTNEALDDTADTSIADESGAIDANTTQNEAGVEDSDETGALVIDEGKQPKGKKSKVEPKTPATPKVKEPKTPRGKAKKEEAKKEEPKNDDDKDDEPTDEKKDEEIVSRSGRKIKPKRYMDEQTEENTTLPSPAPKKRRGASPPADKEKVEEKLTGKLYNTVTQAELEDIKEPFSDDTEKKNLLIVYVPSGQYVGIKLFQSRPSSFKNDAARLEWDRRAAANALTLKSQLEKGHITPQSVCAQLEMDLNLTDEEKATLDKDRENEEKKSRLQFLKTEMKLIELDAKIKTCLSLEKADTQLCLKLLSDLAELEVKPLMLLKHPTCLETVKRMRAYVGNTPSWDLSESAAVTFSKHAQNIRKQADALYNSMKNLFFTPEGLSFWEFFSERVLQFKKATATLSADELLEMVHEPLEMSTPTAVTMKAAIDAVNEDPPEQDAKKKSSPVKNKKNASTPSKPVLKRQSSRNKAQDKEETSKLTDKEENEKADLPETDNLEEKNENGNENVPEHKTDEPMEVDKADEEKTTENADKIVVENDSSGAEVATNNEEEKDKDSEEKIDQEETNDLSKDKTDQKEEADKKEDKLDKKEKITKKEEKQNKKDEKANKKEEKLNKKEEKLNKKEEKLSKKEEKLNKKEEKSNKNEEKDKEVDEPRAKRSRESKKTEAPAPRSPIKRKSKS